MKRQITAAFVLVGSASLTGLYATQTSAAPDAGTATYQSKPTSTFTSPDQRQIPNYNLGNLNKRILCCTLNFDDVPSGTAIDTHYASQGITFGVVNGGPNWIPDPTRHVYAVTAPPSPNTPSPTNAITIYQVPVKGGQSGTVWPDMFVGADGGIQVTFSKPVSSVSVSAEVAYTLGQSGMGLLPPLNLPFLVAFNSSSATSNTWIGQALDRSDAGLGFGAWGTIVPVNAQGGAVSSVTSVVLGADVNKKNNGTANVMFDNLSWTP